eukprot:353440-Chlamydomonas_euryale.AAC.2
MAASHHGGRCFGQHAQPYVIAARAGPRTPTPPKPVTLACRRGIPTAACWQWPAATTTSPCTCDSSGRRNLSFSQMATPSLSPHWRSHQMVSVAIVCWGLAHRS